MSASLRPRLRRSSSPCHREFFASEPFSFAQSVALPCLACGLIFCAYAFAQCSLYGRDRINIKDNLQSDETAPPLDSTTFFGRYDCPTGQSENQNYNLESSAVIIQ